MLCLGNLAEVPRIEIVGGLRPGNDLQYIP